MSSEDLYIETLLIANATHGSMVGVKLLYLHVLLALSSCISLIPQNRHSPHCLPFYALLSRTNYSTHSTLVLPQIFPDAIPHREQADYHAKMRGSKLEESQKAYQAGHKANAHELSVEVRP